MRLFYAVSIMQSISVKQRTGEELLKTHVDPTSSAKINTYTYCRNSRSNMIFIRICNISVYHS